MDIGREVIVSTSKNLIVKKGDVCSHVKSR